MCVFGNKFIRTQSARELRVASCELRVASNYGRAPVRVKYSVHAHTIAYAHKFGKFKIVSTRSSA